MADTLVDEPVRDKCEPEGGGHFMGSGASRNVTIIAYINDKGDVDFKMESDLKKDPDKDQLTFDKTADHMPKKDYYLVDFDLKDDTKLKLEFAPNPMLAFWVNMGSPFNPEPKCPQTPSYCEEVYAVSVSKKRLTVRNEDEIIATFRFSLGFLKGGEDPKSQTSYVRFDPIGENRDGGS